MNDKFPEEYRNDILTLWNIRTRERANISAYLIYGKFLNFLEKKNFTGAKLSKQFLRIGKVNCRSWKKNNFKKYYTLASNNEDYLNLKRNFFWPQKSMS